MRWNNAIVAAGVIAVLLFAWVGLASAAVITVDDSGGADYTTIQAAIKAAIPGDTIEIHSGTYYENVNVNKQLTVQGVDTGDGVPAVDAGGSGSAINLSADEITLERFITTNWGHGWENAGIKITSNNNTVIGNDVSNNKNEGVGICLKSSSNNTITGNNASNNYFAGIYLHSSSSNIIIYNNANNNGYGIEIEYSNSNTIKSNNVNNNNNVGIDLSHANSNIVINNNASNNDYGIYLSFSNHNIITTNIANNIQKGIFLLCSSSNTIKSNVVCNNYIGIAIHHQSSSYYSEHNTIFGNYVSDNNYGIWLAGDICRNNLFYQNNIVDNTYNASDDCWLFTNQWDDGNIGNHYSNFDEPCEGCNDNDGDGICDSSYSIPGYGSSVDRYPLVSWSGDTSQEVQFKGVATNILTFFSTTVYTIQIGAGISDPTGSMHEGDIAKVSYSYDSAAQVDSVEVGDKVEVHGTYTGYESGEHTIALVSSGSSLVESGDMSFLWTNVTGRVYSVAISSDGNYVVAGSDKCVYLFDKTGDLKWNKSVGDYVYSVDISSDGNYVVAGSGDSVYYFDKYENRLWKHDTTDRISSVTVSDDGTNVAFTSYDGYVYYFDKTGFIWHYETANPPSTVSISSDGEKIAVGCYEWVYYFNKNGFVWDCEIGGSGSSEISISDDGEYVAIAGGWGSSYYFDKDKNILWEFDPEQCGNSVKVSSDGKYIVLGSGSWGGGNGWVYYFSKDSNIPIWENKTFQCVGSVDISSDGEYVVAGSHPTFTLHYFNNTGGLLFDYPIRVWSAKISGDGKYIVAAGNKWDVEDGMYFFGPATGDSDGDGKPDEVDNCPYIYNPKQIDNNKNGIGDMCEIIEEVDRLRENSTDKISRDVDNTAKIQAKIGREIFDKEEKNIVLNSLQISLELLTANVLDSTLNYLAQFVTFELIDNLLEGIDEDKTKQILNAQAQVDVGYREFIHPGSKRIQDFTIYDNGQENRLIVLTKHDFIKNEPGYVEIYRYDFAKGGYQPIETVFPNGVGFDFGLKVEAGDVNNDDHDDLLMVGKQYIRLVAKQHLPQESCTPPSHRAPSTQQNFR